MKRFLVNLSATFVLVLLIAAPGAISANLVDFGKYLAGITVYNTASKFGDYLKLRDAGNGYYNLEFRVFSENLALYPGILEIENRSEKEALVEIENYTPEIEIFFEREAQTFGPKQVKLLPNQRTRMNLLAPAASVKTATANFSLKLNQ